MPDLPQRAHVRFAGLAELDEIVTHPLSAWPPPGTHIENRFQLGPGDYVGSLNDLNAEVVANDGEQLPTEGFWWATLLELLSGVPDWVSRFGVRLLELYVSAVPSWVGPVSSIPIYFRANEGLTMRWLKSTFRGELGGGVEQFQFSINWGNPGADPDIVEGAALTFAELLATNFASAMNVPSYAGGTLAQLFSTEVKFTEVGVTTQTQTDATSADGSGGNLEQSYPTQWFAYAVGDRPTGAAAGVCLPYEVSCAVTLQTDTRGARGRGRIYLPPFSVSKMTAGGLFAADATANAGFGIGQFFTQVLGASPYVPLVVSRRAIQLHAITSINTGRVPDSQRRRRRSQDEARVQAPDGTQAGFWAPV